jgi:hypothetical protein
MFVRLLLKVQDVGFQAFTLDDVEIIQPIKKLRGKALTRAQKEGNRKISRRRVRIEHVNSSIKRCRMLKETVRLWKAGVRDMVMEIGCALHNLRVRLTPSWTPDGLNRDELYHTERNHQGLDNQLIAPGPEVGRTTGTA